MDSKTFTIGILSLSAVVLLVANLIVPSVAEAQIAVKDRDYQVVTARVQASGDGLYIVDNRTGLMAVFTYDAAKKSIIVRDVRKMSEAFNVR